MNTHKESFVMSTQLQADFIPTCNIPECYRIRISRHSIERAVERMVPTTFLYKIIKHIYTNKEYRLEIINSHDGIRKFIVRDTVVVMRNIKEDYINHISLATVISVKDDWNGSAVKLNYRKVINEN